MLALVLIAKKLTLISIQHKHTKDIFSCILSNAASAACCAQVEAVPLNKEVVSLD